MRRGAAPEGTAVVCSGATSREVTVAAMSVKDMKRHITDAGLSHQDCFEKAELCSRAVAALERLAGAKVVAAKRAATC